MPGTTEPRPRIGITAWRRALPTALGERTDLYTLGVEYVHAVHDAGGLALVLPHDSDPGQTLDALDGLVLSGGGDIDPRSYRECNVGDSKDMDAEADAWEIALVRAAEARGLPVLGICRGMQIMAVASGGRLDQDIAGCEGHPDMRAMAADAVLAARHAVTLDPASTLGSIYGVPARQVNTIHHQAVSDAGALRVAARGAGGLVEALEAPGGWAAVGVQWHPEKATRDEARAEGLLFGHLVDRARAFRRSKQEHGR